jgi:hypothetical protein
MGAEDSPGADDGYPAKHLFGVNRVRIELAEANRKGLPARNSNGPRAPETLSSQPKGYPFKRKAAAPIQTKALSGAPVSGGRAVGADTPK